MGAKVRWAAVKAIPLLAEKGDQHTVKIVSACLAHEDCNVRSAALEALALVVMRGDHMALRAVRACLEDEDGAVRAAAVRVLARLTVEYGAETQGAMSKEAEQ